jgi:hypothetical protein
MCQHWSAHASNDPGNTITVVIAHFTGNIEVQLGMEINFKKINTYRTYL